MPKGIYERTPEMREKCRANFRKASETNRGKPRSIETKRKISEANKAFGLRPWNAELNARPDIRKKRSEQAKRAIVNGERPWVFGWAKTGTKLEALVAALLDSAGVEFVSQHQIGTKIVDFFIPSVNAVIEADGVYWHRDRPNDERDGYLLRHVSAVTHITDDQLREAGWL